MRGDRGAGRYVRDRGGQTAELGFKPDQLFAHLGIVLEMRGIFNMRGTLGDTLRGNAFGGALEYARFD